MISHLSSDQATLAVCGDPITCRALVLLLRGPDYDVKYLPIASLGATGALAGVRVLLVALERDATHRAALLDELKEATDATKIHVLELTAVHDGRPEWPRGYVRSDRGVPWPCSTEELKQHIEQTLSNNPPAFEGPDRLHWESG